MPRKKDADTAEPTAAVARPQQETRTPSLTRPPRPSVLVDTRVIYCDDCLEQLRRLPDRCVDLTYVDPPFNSKRNDEVFWGETKEKRAFEDGHARAAAYLDFWCALRVN